MCAIHVCPLLLPRRALTVRATLSFPLPASPPVCSAKNIKNTAKRNEDVNEQLVRKLREEIEELRRALAAAQQGGGAGAPTDGSAAAAAGGAENSLSDAQRQSLEEMIANLERAKQASWDEKERLSQMYEQERHRNLENETKIMSVMQTMKEENAELMKKIKGLVNERARLAKTFKKLKDTHLDSREALAAEVAQ